MKEENTHMRLMQYMEENYSRVDLTIAKICVDLFLSRSKLHRYIRDNFQFKTTEFITIFRLQKSINLLTTDYSVKDTSLAVGFADPRYFAKLFKKHFGCTPSDYKVKNENGQ